MSNVKSNRLHRLLAAFLAFVMVISMIPFTVVVNATESADSFIVTVTDGEKPIEGATVTLTGKEDCPGFEMEATTDVNGIVSIEAVAMVEKFSTTALEEYVDIEITVSKDEYESYKYDLNDIPAATGPDAHSRAVVLNRKVGSILQVNLAEKNITVLDEVEFEVSSIANSDKNRMVKGYFTFSDPSAIKELKYYETTAGMEGWYVLKGEFGPETGFPVMDATSKFRVTFNKSGVFDLCVSLKEVTASGIGKVVCENKSQISVAKKQITGIDILPVTGLQYNGEYQSLVELVGNFADGDEVIWEVTGGTGDTTGTVPKGMAVGTYTVVLTVKRDEYHEDFVKTIQDIEIALGELNLGNLKIEAINRTYDATSKPLLEVTKDDDYSLEYSIDNKATWIKDTIPTATEAGEYVVYVKATKDGYNDKDTVAFPITVTIEKANQSFDFINEEYEDGATGTTEIPGKVPYGKEYDFSAIDTDNLAGGKLTYAVELSEEGIASIDGNGILTVNYPGTIKVIVTLSGNNNYNASIIEYQLDVYDVVSAQGQYIGFEKDKVEYTLGISETIAAQVAKRNDDRIKGDIYYAIDKTPGVSINSITGEVSVTNYEELAAAIRATNGSTLELTVTATKEKSGRYGEDSASYKITVSFEIIPENAYRLLAAATLSGWYVHTVEVAPAEGYTIGQSVSGSFGDTTEFSDQGQNDRFVYLKNSETGGITDKIAVVDDLGSNLRIDTVKPETSKMTIEFSEPKWYEEVARVLTLGFYNPSVTITFKAEDTTSGVDHFNWTYTKSEDSSSINLGDIKNQLIKATDQDGVAIAVLTLPASDADQMHGKISFTATDKAGNTSEYKADDRVFVIDTISPTISVKYEGQEPGVSEKQSIEDIHYFNGSVEVELTVTEANFYKEDVIVTVAKDGQSPESTAVAWKLDGVDDAHVGTFTLSGDGDYVVYIDYTDKTGNKMSSYESDIITIDTTKPIVKIDYYHKGNSQGTVFTVVEHNFRPSDIAISGTMKGIDGSDVELTANELTDLLRKAVWAQDAENPDKYTVSVSNEYVNGIYNLTMEYTDISGWNADPYTADEFIIDRAAPTGVKIEYVTEPLYTFLGVVTLGLYNPSVTVKFTAYDTSAGVKSFTWSYSKDPDASTIGHVESINASEATTAVAVPDPDDKTKFTATVTLTAEQFGQLKGNLAVYATDTLGNDSTKIVDSGNVIVVDTVAPTLKVEYVEADRHLSSDNKYFYNNDIEVKLIVTEANFISEDIKVTVTKDGIEFDYGSINWGNRNEKDEIIGTFLLNAPVDHSGDGEYVIKVEYIDRSQNVMETYVSDIHVIDTILPVISFEYDRTTQKTTITVVEHNFDVNGIVIGDTSRIEDITSTDLSFNAKELTTVLQNAAKWVTEGDTYTFEYDYQSDGVYANGIYDLVLNVTDYASNLKTDEPETFIIDHVAPEKTQIEYTQSITNTILEFVTLGFYNPDVEITFTAYDYASGVDTFTWFYTKEENVSNINRDTDIEKFVVNANPDENDASKFTASIILPAEKAEQLRGYISVTATDKYNNIATEFVDDKHIIVVDTIAPSMSVQYTEPITTIENTNYYNGDVNVEFTVNEANFFAEDVIVTVSKDKETPYTVTPEWVDKDADIHIGTFTLTGDGDYIVYVEYTDRSTNAMVSYSSDIKTIDTTAPVIDFSFDQVSQKTTFTVTEHNFRASDITVTGQIGDIKGNDVELNAAKLTDILRSANWKANGDVYTYVYDYNYGGSYVSGIYDLEIGYTDISQNNSTDEPETFTIDHDIPVDVTIEYSQSLTDTVLEFLTLGFYNPNVTLTFTAYDYASGVSSFAWDYTKQEGESNINRDTDSEQHVVDVDPDQNKNGNSKFTASITLPAEQAEQLRGHISVVATDAYGNSSARKEDTNYIVIVDTISPTMSVEYSEPSRTVDTTHYYNGEVNVAFTVTEANFFSDDVVVMISKDGGAAYAIVPDWTDTSVDVHVGTYTLTGDGNYVISVSYTDRSDNTMSEYVSDTIIIDTIKPVINVQYQNNEVVTTLVDRNDNNRKYYGKEQTAIITVWERNFLADEVEFTITATDVTGETLDVSLLHSKSEWNSTGDGHTITITYPGDANYSFDLTYTDLATNVAEEYETDYFTVDNTPPTNIKVEYSTHVWETILESITFGFYNAKMTVTITADDVTSGVHGFIYSYLNAEGVSGVNAELIDQAITAADIEYSNNGKTATVSFEIPKMVLSNDNQFNGTVEFTVSDRANKTAEHCEEKRIVVDNIAPTAQITYNEATKVVGDISYYAGDIDVTVTINEANFYSEDVFVLVSKDGGAAAAVTPNWTDINVDVHVGTFTLSEDGDYIITINYKDKSSNEMSTYTSKQLTIDTVIDAPTYSINGNTKVDEGGAYKGDVTVGFNFADQNYYVNTIKLTKTRFDSVEDVTEKFIVVNGNEKGGSGSFTIPAEVDQDGIYVLTISMSDHAKHTIESRVKFTINRFGSVYEYSDELVNLIKNGGQYVPSVNNDLTIIEYNADKILEDSLKILITRDGETIEVDYTSTPETIDASVQIGESGWYEYIYTIKAANFTEDGVYRITIASAYKTDDAESNDSSSVPDNSIDENGNKILDSMSFTVDDTAPEIRNIVNLEERIINAQTLEVKYTIVDVGGLKSIEIILNGKTLETITDFGENLLNYSGKFTIGESADAQTVQIRVTDLAGNVTDTASESFNSGDLYVFNDTITVSTNIFVRWYANEPLFWGSIIGVVVLAAAIWFAIARRRNKTEVVK